MYRMRHIATSLKGSYFLTAEFNKKVYCWDLDSFNAVSEFNTMLDFGGKRLAITEDGTRCIAAAYSRYGISMYDTSNGFRIWQRKDIKKTQFLSFSPSNEKIYVGIEGKSMVVIKREDGSDDEIIKSATKIYFDLIQSKPVFLKGQNRVVSDHVNIQSPTFTFLDVQPTRTGIVLSAAGSELFYYNYTEQKPVWKIYPKKNEHFLKIAYSPESNSVYAILYKYNDPRKEPFYLLYKITAFDGNIDFIFPLPLESCEYGFAQDSTKLICSGGEIYELTGSKPELVHKFGWD